MKTILFAATLGIASAFALSVDAQSAQSSTASAANNQFEGTAAAIAYAEGPTFTSPSTVTTIQQGGTRLENVPNVSAPAVFGGGHPCLAGQSGGFSVVGGGLTYGRGDADPICMAWVMGQPEVAIRMMAKKSPSFCESLNAVGYYRLGNTVVPATCSKDTVGGGADTPGTQIRDTRVSTKGTRVAYGKCGMEDGKIKLTVRRGQDRDLAISQCKAALR